MWCCLPVRGTGAPQLPRTAPLPAQTRNLRRDVERFLEARESVPEPATSDRKHSPLVDFNDAGYFDEIRLGQVDDEDRSRETSLSIPDGEELLKDLSTCPKSTWESLWTDLGDGVARPSRLLWGVQVQPVSRHESWETLEKRERWIGFAVANGDAKTLEGRNPNLARSVVRFESDDKDFSGKSIVYFALPKA
jgi:hypothetical protein